MKVASLILVLLLSCCASMQQQRETYLDQMYFHTEQHSKTISDTLAVQKDRSLEAKYDGQNNVDFEERQLGLYAGFIGGVIITLSIISIF